MERPPTLIEAQHALREVRMPYEERLTELRAACEWVLRGCDREENVHEPRFVAAAGLLNHRIRQQEELLARLPDHVCRTLVVRDTDTGQLNALALVTHADPVLPTLLLRGWEIRVVSGSLRLNRCRVGDVVPGGFVVSIDGSPIAAEPDLPIENADPRSRRIRADTTATSQEHGRQADSHEPAEAPVVPPEVRQLKSGYIWHQRAERARAILEHNETVELQYRKRRREQREAYRRERERKIYTDRTILAERARRRREQREKDRQRYEQQLREDAVLEAALKERRHTLVLFSAFVCGCAIGYLIARPVFSLVGAAAAFLVGTGVRFWRRGAADTSRQSPT